MRIGSDIRRSSVCPDAFASKPAPTVKLRGHKDGVSREDAGARAGHFAG
jgi:hypothetical protein